MLGGGIHLSAGLQSELDASVQLETRWGLTNAFKLCELMNQSRQEHQRLIEDVVMALSNEGEISRNLPFLPLIITQLKALRGNHEWQDLSSIRKCFKCRKDVQTRAFGNGISENRGGAPRTQGGCRVCGIYLWRKGNGMKRVHATDDNRASSIDL